MAVIEANGCLLLYGRMQFNSFFHKIENNNNKSNKNSSCLPFLHHCVQFLQLISFFLLILQGQQSHWWQGAGPRTGACYHNQSRFEGIEPSTMCFEGNMPTKIINTCLEFGMLLFKYFGPFSLCSAWIFTQYNGNSLEWKPFC